MSGGRPQDPLVKFESSWKKKDEREVIKEARKKVLGKAKERFEKEEARRDKEEKWMLPTLEHSLTDSKKKKKKKKEKKKKKKKEKKAKKSKKKKKRQNSGSSSSSSSSDDDSEASDEWVEKKGKVPVEPEHDKPKGKWKKRFKRRLIHFWINVLFIQIKKSYKN